MRGTARPCRCRVELGYFCALISLKYYCDFIQFAFLQALNKFKPKHVKAYGTMSMVRNSIGANGYVADEIITARSGVRVSVAKPPPVFNVFYVFFSFFIYTKFFAFIL